MPPKIIYAELKTGYSHNGPAWIGMGHYSKSGNTIYLNGKAFKKAQGIRGNYYDIETKEEYWISGARRDGRDRLFSTRTKTFIDRKIVEEYLDYRGLYELYAVRYQVIDFEETLIKEKVFNIENEVL